MMGGSLLRALWNTEKLPNEFFLSSGLCMGKFARIRCTRRAKSGVSGGGHGFEFRVRTLMPYSSP